LIRQYFPKGTDFYKITLKEIKSLQNRLNNRPKKALGFSTPIKEFKKLTGALKT
jgi:IS30 family transposase